MAEYTRNLNLYKPSRLDSSVPVDESLAQNFEIIEGQIGPALVDGEGVKRATLDERLKKDTEKLNDKVDDGSFIHDVEVTYHRDAASETDYILTRIKHRNPDGSVNLLKRGYAGDNPAVPALETARSYAARHNTTLTLNASTYTGGNPKRRGTDIFEGVAQIGDENYGRWELGVKADNVLKAYPPRTPSNVLVEDGVLYSFTGFCPFVQDGKATLEDYYINVSANTYEPHPRNAIAQYENKDFVFLTCDGRTPRNKGMTIADMARIFVSLGVKYAYNLDGGGSTQTVVRGTQVNRNSDENGFAERPVVDFMYFKKELKTKRDQDINAAYHDIGAVNKKVEDVKRTLETAGASGVYPERVNVGSSPNDLNTIKVSGTYWGHATISQNIPTAGISWAVQHFQYDDTSAMQIAFPFHESNGVAMTRRTNGSNGAWHPWRAM